MFRNLLISISAAILSLNLPSQGISAPIVPAGFVIEKFVDIPDPVDLDIDSSGNIYVGHGSIDSGFTPLHIRKVTPAGVVTEIGDPIPDPDAVIIDEFGDVVGAGNIIVGGDLQFFEVNPDTGATSIAYTGEPLHNIQQMAFDSSGRLFAGHHGGLGVTVIENDILSSFYDFSGNSSPALTIDENDQMFVGLYASGQVHTFDLTSPGSPPSLLSTIPGVPVRFGYSANPGPFSSTLFVGTATGEIYSIDRNNGDIELFASGFGSAHAITFGPDGSMFVSDNVDEAIYRINVPEPSSMVIAILGLTAMPPRHRRHRQIDQTDAGSS